MAAVDCTQLDMNMNILVAALLFRLLIGVVIALIAKGKELVATITLIFIFGLTESAFLFSARFITPYPHPLLQAILSGILQPTVMLLRGPLVLVSSPSLLGLETFLTRSCFSF
jgi:hypothetical protein